MNDVILDEAWRLHRAGDYARATELYRELLRTDPKNFDALYRLGFLYGQRGQFEEAQHVIGEAIKFRATPDALLTRAHALGRLGRHEEALACLGQAIRLKPDFPHALLNRAAVLFRLRRYEEAAADYGRLLEIGPDFPFARGNRLFCRLHGCDWRSWAEERRHIATALKAGKRVVAPFDAKALGIAPHDELRCARIWGADQCPTMPPQWRGERYVHDRIRIAYVSANFHAHAAATLIAGMIEHHDRKRFETIAISLGKDDGSAMRARLGLAFERFVDAQAKSDDETAALLRQMEVDIAVDMMGFTEDCRPGIFARRAAPLQVNYLGFPGTMGADFIDYIVADPIVVPKSVEDAYAEKLVYLPHGFMPADSTRRVGEETPTRAEAGLPPDGFVFCSFNASYKLTPEMFDVWMRLLKTVEGSVFWLGQIHPTAARNLKREAEARGVSAERLVFAPYVASPDDHLARLRLADLFLDTFPYNAHATASDALWAGLPVLTVKGEGFASRVAASLLHAAALPELVTQSLEEYGQRALNLAMGRTTLSEITAKLRRSRDICPLFDTARYTRHLETAFARMWEHHQNGGRPESFAVEAATP
jgi:predicted O-linked N-acetylglucosamine transferase (SPINDLY family)